MIDKLTAAECELIAHYGFQGRVGDVVSKTIGYQWARKQLAEAQEEVEVATAALQAAIMLADQLPDRLNLKATAEHELGIAQANLDRARGKLPYPTEAFFEVAGPAAPLLVEMMEGADWALTGPALTAALEAERAA